MDSRDNLRARLRYRGAPAQPAPSQRTTTAQPQPVASQPAVRPIPAAVSQKPKNNKPGSKKLLNSLIIVMAVALVAVIAALSYLYIDTKNDLKTTQQQLAEATNTNPSGSNEMEQVISVVKKSVELPSSETPTFGVIDDVEVLKDEPYFRDVQTGDKFLLYKQAGVALVYRPSTKKIVVYAPVNTQN